MVCKYLMIWPETFCGAGMWILIFISLFIFYMVLCDVMFAGDCATLRAVSISASEPKYFVLLILYCILWDGWRSGSDRGVMVIRFTGHLIVRWYIVDIFSRRCHILVTITILKTIIINILLFWNHFVLLLDC